ncbi:MAG TPA: hypothetical protein VGR61_10515 [Candidatus Dormibacteraeota bacterium]|nr:hypothetical protein [Candidatus Dormibacteraeota bacterium]
MLVAGAIGLTLLPTGASLGSGDAGVSLGGLSRTAVWLAIWATTMVLAGAAATGRSVPLGGWAITGLAVALAVARMPVALAGLLLVTAIVVPRLAVGPASAGWSRTLVLSALAGFGAVAAGTAMRQHGDDLLAGVVVLGFLAAVGALPFGWHMVRWLKEASPQLGALVVSVLLPALVTALVAAEAVLAQVHGTQRAGFLLGLFGGATAVAGAVYAMGATDWRTLALRTTPCEVGLALVGIGAFDIHGLQAAALTLALIAFTRPVLFFVDGLGPRRGAGLVATALALVAAAGLPPTVGFPARLLVLSAASRIHPLVAVLAATGVLLELVALVLVLRRRLARPAGEVAVAEPRAARLLAVATVVALIYGGIFPGFLLRFVFRLGGG